MVGSTQSISDPNVVLNTIVADELSLIADRLEKADNAMYEAHEIVKELLTAHKRIIFNGNGYSDEWVAEAEKRGLPNLKSMVDAIPSLVTDKAIEMFEKHGVYTKAELESVQRSCLNSIQKTLDRVLYCEKQIVPAVIKYQTSLAESVNTIKQQQMLTQAYRKNY